MYFFGIFVYSDMPIAIYRTELSQKEFLSDFNRRRAEDSSYVFPCADGKMFDLVEEFTNKILYATPEAAMEAGEKIRKEVMERKRNKNEEK